jgi:signal transduction histidine kinase
VTENNESNGADGRLLQLVHDLRTPLTVVSGFAELLQRDVPPLTEERRAEYVSRIAAAAQELREILDAQRTQRLP